MNTDFFQAPNSDSCSFVGFVARRLGFRTKINSADNGVAELSSVVNPEHCALGCCNQVFHFFLSQRDHADGIQLQALVGEGMAESKSTEEAVGAARVGAAAVTGATGSVAAWVLPLVVVAA